MYGTFFATSSTVTLGIVLMFCCLELKFLYLSYIYVYLLQINHN